MLETIIIIEDEAELRSVWQEYLELRGYRVLPCGSREEARASVRAHGPPGFALVDWSLPDASGQDVCDDLRATAPTCRIVVTTGLSRGALPPGVDAVLTKPFTLAQLDEALRRLADG